MALLNYELRDDRQREASQSIIISRPKARETEQQTDSYIGKTRARQTERIMNERKDRAGGHPPTIR